MTSTVKTRRPASLIAAASQAACLPVFHKDNCHSMGGDWISEKTKVRLKYILSLYA